MIDEISIDVCPICGSSLYWLRPYTDTFYMQEHVCLTCGTLYLSVPFELDDDETDDDPEEKISLRN